MPHLLVRHRAIQIIHPNPRLRFLFPVAVKTIPLQQRLHSPLKILLYPRRFLGRQRSRQHQQPQK